MTPDTVLIVSASYDIAADYVAAALEERGTPTFRLNTDQFPGIVRACFRPRHGLVLDDGCQTVSSDRVKSVWYRRLVSPQLPPDLDDGVRDFCERETRSFLTGALATVPTDRWMSPPQAIGAAERKPYQLSVASQLGFTVPNTLITNVEAAALDFAADQRLVAKAVSSGYIMGERENRAIFTSAVEDGDLTDLGGLPLAPVTFQELIDKAADLRVTVVNDAVFAAEILSQARESSRIDWRATDDPLLEHRRHELPDDVAALCRGLVRRLGLVFGAIDLAVRPDDTYVFFEINPNGEWVWIEDRLDYPISRKIAAWLDGEAV